jgi:hypothetical protein
MPDEWDGYDRRKGLERRSGYDRRGNILIDDEKAAPGFTINSWQQVQSILYVLVMLVAGIAWGLKLEARIDRADDGIKNAEQQLAHGILPITEERMSRMDTENRRLLADLEGLRAQVQKLELEFAGHRSNNGGKMAAPATGRRL